ncbi:LexA family transcriptional regulator [Peribacillus muralis]|uniref:LexA family transcriptional regulator n=1 Tax=Peribacillus muralis TaxID=264697 RepID=UPI003D0873FD
MIDRDLPLKKEISENIKKFLKQNGWTQLMLSEKSGISKSTLSDYMNCKTLINPGNVEKLANAFKINNSEIDPSFKRTDKVKEEKVTYLFEEKEYLDIPLYGSISAGALAVVDCVTKNELDHLRVSHTILGKHADNKNLFSMKVNGDSMNKIIPHGSFVVSKRIDCSEVKDDDIVIFSYDGEYSMKRVRYDHEDRVMIFSPESKNRKFRDITVPFDAPNDLKIYAKVVWYSVELD